MAAQNNSQELRVMDADIEKDLEKFGIVDIGVTIFIPEKEIDKEQNSSVSSASDTGAVSGTKMSFGEGKVTSTHILIPIQNAMSIPTANLDEKKKEQINEKAKKSKEVEKEKDR